MSICYPYIVPVTAQSGGNDSFTVALLHFDGADGSTTFTDSAVGGSGHIWTPAGGVQIDTAESKFGGSSGLFAASGEHLLGDGSSDFAFGTGDLTVDFWLRPANDFSLDTYYDGRVIYTDTDTFAIYRNTDNTVRFFIGEDKITGTTAVVSGSWWHIAATRSSGSTRLFINGTQEGITFSDSTNYTISANRPVIGNNVLDFNGGFGANGWLEELRISKGIARWTSNFTPPSVPYS